MAVSSVIAPKQASTASPKSERLDFFSTLALLLGMEIDHARSLAEGDPFSGPSGLTCLLQKGDTEETQELVRPQIHLPIHVQDLIGEEFLHLLAVQALLMTEKGWWLSADAKGLLTLTSLNWYDDPAELAAALDAANLLGPSVLGAILAGAD